MKLSGKTTVITGGNSGIGFGIARRFADDGATGIIIGRNEERLAQASRDLDGAFAPLRCDVTDIDALESTFADIGEQLGHIDVLVVNAGGAVGAGTIQPFEHVDATSFDAMTNLNLRSVFFTVQKALPYLSDNASVILVSSIAAHKAFPGMSVYSAAKAGVRALARSMSAELLGRGIRVNVLSPGTIDTPVFDKMGLPESEVTKFKGEFENIIPVRRAGTPKEMGATAAFLASSDSSFIVGAEIIADGGVVNL